MPNKNNLAEGKFHLKGDTYLNVSINDFKCGCFEIKVGSKYGLLNNNGQVVIAPIYGELESMSDNDNYIIAHNDSKYSSDSLRSIFTCDGTMLRGDISLRIESISDNMYTSRCKSEEHRYRGCIFSIDNNELLVEVPNSDVFLCGDNLAIVETADTELRKQFRVGGYVNHICGVINVNGDMIIETKYPFLKYVNGYFIAWEPVGVPSDYSIDREYYNATTKILFDKEGNEISTIDDPAILKILSEKNHF